MNEEKDNKVVQKNFGDSEIAIVEETFLTDSKDQSNIIKQQQLNKLKTKTYIIYTVVVILATALSLIYSYYDVKLAIDSLNLRLDDYFIDFSKTSMLSWICSAIFSVGQISMSLLMMRLLRDQFDDFYAEYGCFLWTVVTIQAISLTI